MCLCGGTKDQKCLYTSTGFIPSAVQLRQSCLQGYRRDLDQRLRAVSTWVTMTAPYHTSLRHYQDLAFCTLPMQFLTTRVSLVGRSTRCGKTKPHLMRTFRTRWLPGWAPATWVRGNFRVTNRTLKSKIRNQGRHQLLCHQFLTLRQGQGVCRCLQGLYQQFRIP